MKFSRNKARDILVSRYGLGKLNIVFLPVLSSLGQKSDRFKKQQHFLLRSNSHY